MKDWDILQTDHSDLVYSFVQELRVVVSADQKVSFEEEVRNQTNQNNNYDKGLHGCEESHVEKSNNDGSVRLCHTELSSFVERIDPWDMVAKNLRVEPSAVESNG